jgi:hypothetical protein
MLFLTSILGKDVAHARRIEALATLRASNVVLSQMVIPGYNIAKHVRFAQIRSELSRRHLRKF